MRQSTLQNGDEAKHVTKSLYKTGGRAAAVCRAGCGALRCGWRLSGGSGPRCMRSGRWSAAGALDGGKGLRGGRPGRRRAGNPASQNWSNLVKPGQKWRGGARASSSSRTSQPCGPPRVCTREMGVTRGTTWDAGKCRHFTAKRWAACGTCGDIMNQQQNEKSKPTTK
jgi:hypothetical protein